MILDYGKTAYVKVQELEKKILQLQQEINKNVYKSIDFNFYPSGEVESVYWVRFNALKSAVSKIKFNINTQSSVEYKFTVKLYIQQECICTKTVELGKEDGFEIDVALNSGKNEIKILLVSSISYTLKSIKVIVNGYVDYLNEYNRLTKTTYNGVDYVLHVSGESATLYTYTPADGLIARSKFSELKDACIGGVITNKLLIVTVDAYNSLKVMFLELSNFEGSYYDIGIDGVSSVAAYLNGNRVRILFVKFNNVYAGNFTASGNFSCEKTGRRGSAVFADADCQGVYFISTDARGSKLVIE